MSNNIYISPHDNQVIITQPVTNIIEVLTSGPQGAVGPKGDSAPFIQIGTSSVWYTTSDIEITGSLTISGSNTFTNIGLGLFTGSVIITGSAIYNGYEILNTSLTGSLVTTSSFNTFTSSYIQDSASFDTRILINSSSITILSGSFLTLSGSYLVASASFDSKINLLSASLQGFSSSYVIDSGSVNTRLNDLEIFSSSLSNTFATDQELNTATASLSSSIAFLSGSYLQSSASFNDEIINNSSSVILLSSSFLLFSSSYNTGSFTGSFVGDGSQLSGIVSSKWTGSNPLSRESDVLITGSLKVTNGITGSFSGSGIITNAVTASYALNAGTTVDTGSLVTTSSFNTFTSSYNVDSSSFSIRITNNSSSVESLSSSFVSFSSSYNTGSFTGSFKGDGSGLTNIPASGITGLNLSQIASGSATASISPNNGLVINTNTTVQGALTASSALINGDIRIKGTASVDVLITSYESSSIIYSSGSTKFGDTFDDTHTFTGSVYITGSDFTWNNEKVISSGITSSMSVLNAVTASNTILQNTILTNQTVGALPTGTTLPVGTGLESILRTMLVTYIPPTLSSLVMRIGGSNISTSARDVGNSFTTNTASFSATADNPTGIFPISSSWTASGADIGTQTFYFGDNVLSSSNVRSVGNLYTINRATADGTVTFTVNGRRSDTGATITATTTSVAFQWRNYLSATSTIPTDNTSAQTVVNASVTSALDTNRAWTATCTAANNTTGNFTYIIYPASYGNLSNIIQNGALSVLSAFTNLGDFTITNAYGASILVRIYKSNSDKAFASGTTLAIS